MERTEKIKQFVIIMKRFLLAALSLCSSCVFSLAQDIVTKRDGSEFTAKVIEVGESEIKYKKFDNLEGPTYTIKVSDVFMVKYENGSKDVFSEQNMQSDSESSLLSSGALNTYWDVQRGAPYREIKKHYRSCSSLLRSRHSFCPGREA